MPVRRFTLDKNSPQVNQMDPVTKKMLHAGDAVVECQQGRHVYLASSWEFLGGKCTLCQETSAPDKPLPQEPPKPHAPQTPRNWPLGPLTVTVGGLIIIVACVLVSIVIIILVANSTIKDGPPPSTQIITVSGPTSEVLVITATPQPGSDTRPPDTSGGLTECSDTLAQRLEVGRTGRVTYSNGLAVRVRSQPSTSASVIVKMPEGEHFTVVDGPECAEGWWWWKIRTAGDDVGWAAEGDRSMGYFLEPYP